MRWRVDKQRTVALRDLSEWDVERAVALDLARNRGDTRVVVVGYDIGAPTISARMVVEPHLEADAPPERLHVRRDGQIAAVKES